MRIIYVGLSLLGLTVLTGCGAATGDATSKEIASLTAEISKLRSEQSALSQRLDALERAPERAASPSSPASSVEKDESEATPADSAVSLDSDRPTLAVVHLDGPADGGEGDESDIDAEGPRTILRSGARGIIVEETGPDGALRTQAASKNGGTRTSKLVRR